MFKQYWQRFETWVYSWFPGYKTKAMAALGTLGSLAALLQQFVTGLPITQKISADTMLIVSSVLFTLSYWFKDMGSRVETYQIQDTPKASE